MEGASKVVGKGTFAVVVESLGVLSTEILLNGPGFTLDVELAGCRMVYSFCIVSGESIERRSLDEMTEAEEGVAESSNFSFIFSRGFGCSTHILLVVGFSLAIE